MGLIRVDPEFEKKIKRLHLKLKMENPKKRITIVGITANLDVSEEEIKKKVLNKKKRGNRYFY